jgi:hypothetical protein
MSGTDSPDAPPPEVPEEFAAAYREAYRRALEAGADPYDESFDEDLSSLEQPAQEVLLVGTHRSEVPAPDGAPGPVQRWRASSWFVPSLLALLALVLVVGAYATGKALSDDVEDTSGPTSQPGAVSQRGKAMPTDEPTSSPPSISPGSWDGPVTAVSIDALAADCTATASNDSAGRRVTYVPANAIDGKSQTAWRCSGTAIGQKLTLRLAEDTDVAEVGLIPGYAKTDPESGADRYAENNRITKVRWTFGDGVTVVQRLDPDPDNRTIQLLRVPRTTTDRITLEILAVKKGSRNTTAISELAVASAG